MKLERFILLKSGLALSRARTSPVQSNPFLLRDVSCFRRDKTADLNRPFQSRGYFRKVCPDCIAPGVAGAMVEDEEDSSLSRKSHSEAGP